MILPCLSKIPYSHTSFERVINAKTIGTQQIGTARASSGLTGMRNISRVELKNRRGVMFLVLILPFMPFAWAAQILIAQKNAIIGDEKRPRPVGLES